MVAKGEEVGVGVYIDNEVVEFCVRVWDGPRYVDGQGFIRPEQTVEESPPGCWSWKGPEKTDEWPQGPFSRHRNLVKYDDVPL